MKCYLYILIIAFNSLSYLNAFQNDHVLVLNEDNFVEAISINRFLLVDFYAEWCGHCRNLAPEFSKAAEILANHDPPIYLAKVEASINLNIAKKYNIDAFPTIKFFEEGEPEEYTGMKKADYIVNWVLRKSDRHVVELNSSNDVEKFNERNESCVVFFGIDSDLFSVYHMVAKYNENYLFAYCYSDDCLDHFNAKHGQVTVFKKFDEKRNDLTVHFNESILLSFLTQSLNPKVLEFNDKTSDLIFEKRTPGIFFYIDKNSYDAEKIKELALLLSEHINV